ncbi:uncharacterized protein BDFB_005927 [Asbolus verrucosus]|uniref:CBM39 domain-containing protein n=1 Tax=Asbolus verrucosus TaxID=1661398 RepID=A0A482VJI9_ASBVE|nr:uncharacterized protein BDFB_005927 [Asbolus verrucosus]
MFLAIFVALFVSANGRDLLEPQFQVLTPDELMVQVPKYEESKLVTFRIGIRRKDNDLEDLELGENVMNNNRIFIYDERLDLKRGDVVNYLLAFKDKEGYQAETGKYTFDGVYFKKPFGRRHRFRRSFITTTEKSEYNTDDTEEFNPVDSRFGGGHHHHRYWPSHNSPFGPPQHGPPQFGPPQHGPPQFGPPSFSPPYFPNHPRQGPPPNFGAGCDDHRHDLCHQRDPEKWEKTTSGPDIDYHCRICHKLAPGRKEKSSTTTTTTTEFPDIDIRFSDD